MGFTAGFNKVIDNQGQGFQALGGDFSFESWGEEEEEEEEELDEGSFVAISWNLSSGPWAKLKKRRKKMLHGVKTTEEQLPTWSSARSAGGGRWREFYTPGICLNDGRWERLLNVSEFRCR